MGFIGGFGQRLNCEVSGPLWRGVLMSWPEAPVVSTGACSLRWKKWAFPLVQAEQMATSTPAKRLKLTRKGRLEPGLDADLVVLNPDYSAALTFVGGQERYRQWGG